MANINKGISYGCIAPFAGAPVVFLITAIATGGVNQAGQLIGASIICTAGLGLIVWLPACWIAGIVVVTIISQIMHREKPDDDLVTYIREASARGLSQQEIERKLQSQGWSDEIIQRARHRVDS